MAKGDFDLHAALNAISDVVQNWPPPLREFDQIYMKAGDMVLQSEYVAHWAKDKRLAYIGDGDAISICSMYLRHPGDRLRLGLSSILLCWVVFSAAGLGLYKTTEDHAFTAAADAHGLLGAAHLAIQLLAIVSAAAVALGVIPLVVIALRQARDRRAVERAIVLALACLAVFGLATAALVAVAHLPPAPGDAVAAASLAIWTCLALACGIGCAVAWRLGLFAITVSRDVLRAGAACATVVVLGMIGIALATAVYLAALLHDAPGLASEGNGPLELASVAVSLGIQLAVMALVAALAVLSARRNRGLARAASAKPPRAREPRTVRADCGRSARRPGTVRAAENPLAGFAHLSMPAGRALTIREIDATATALRRGGPTTCAGTAPARAGRALPASTQRLRARSRRPSVAISARASS